MSARVTVTLEELILLKAAARGFSLLPRQPATSLLSGRHASRLRGRGLDFKELRHYQLGDDVRTIDWKATARLRSPQVRVYDEERERPVLLVVDQRSPMFFGSRRAMKSVAAAEAAALGAWKALDVGDRVGGIVFSESEVVEIRPHRSQSRVLYFLGELVRLNQRLGSSTSVSGQVTLNDALERAARCTSHDHLVVLISDLDGADGRTRQLATQLAAHNDMIVAAIYDPLGASLTGGEGMVATDRGQAYSIPGGTEFADSFQDAFGRLLTEWATIFQALRVPVLPISTATPVIAGLWWLWQRQTDPLRGWREQMDAVLLRALVVGKEGIHTHRAWWWLAGWLLALVAVAGPTWRLEPSPFAEDAAPLMILLKAGDSMDRANPSPSPLERAKLKIVDLAELRKGQPLGLIAYAGSAHLVLPPTRDTDVVAEMAAEISPEVMPVPGDRLDLATQETVELLSAEKTGGTLLVIADSVGSETQPNDESTDDARSFPIQFFALTEKGTPEAESMSEAARSLNASVQFLTPDETDVTALAHAAARRSLESIGGKTSRWQEAGYWLVPVLALLVALSFRREESLSMEVRQ